MELDPAQIQSSLSKDQYRLYKLIWSRFLATQMANAIYDTVSIDTECGGHWFKSSHQSLRFPGFIAVYEEGKDEETEAVGSPLPDLQEGDQASIRSLDKQQHFTQPPPRYTEASLVKKLEELGIGRPSTYASILSVLQDRKYVRLDKRRFVPEDRGRIVTAFMENFFNKYVQYDFTADLENSLDDISAGKLNWKELLHAFWDSFSATLKEVEPLSITDVLNTLEDALSEHLFPTEKDRICPECGATKGGRLSLKIGKFGAFIG